MNITPFIGVFFLVILSISNAAIQPADLIRAPSSEQWKTLEQFSGQMTRAEFETQLHKVFDPTDSLSPFLKVTDQSVAVFASTNQDLPVATITFAPPSSSTAKEISSKAESNSLPDLQQTSPPSWPFPSLLSSFFSPSASSNPTPASDSSPVKPPLTGLRVLIDPADIGGLWAPMEDRSTFYPGFGRIQEGDLNLLVSKALSKRLKELGAQVFVTRETAEPVSPLHVSEVEEIVPQVLAYHSYLLSKTFRSRTQNLRKSSPIYQKIVAEVLLTKNLESMARGEKAQTIAKPNITIVLQFDATASRRRSHLPKINRNILFIEGAYTAREITSDPRQRLRLLTKLLQNVTPTEIRVATAISNHFVSATAFPPVLYGNSKITRSIANNPYVIARNILLNREHDGPVVVTEPYFMNHPETLQRLLAGDYEGIQIIAGKPQPSIYREYANAVADGLLDAYRKKEASY